MQWDEWSAPRATRRREDWSVLRNNQLQLRTNGNVDVWSVSQSVDSVCNMQRGKSRVTVVSCSTWLDVNVVHSCRYATLRRSHQTTHTHFCRAANHDETVPH